ncbi:unnamed protein product [Prorocentrum cordatum]|uniref:Uncharacterized protein n=1 Tax=Prorocentrum cordatum TaxID=2364126 RepID=A0ABN9QZD2_9DINO|nr:unnamed protein product [Polarella glacialis]
MQWQFHAVGSHPPTAHGSVGGSGSAAACLAEFIRDDLHVDGDGESSQSSLGSSSPRAAQRLANLPNNTALKLFRDMNRRPRRRVHPIATAGPIVEIGAPRAQDPEWQQQQ